MRLAAVLSILLVWGCASAPPCHPRPLTVGPAFVWEVRGSTGGSMTLFGSHHAAGDRDVPAAAWQALDAADIYVAEAEEPIEGETYDSDALLREKLELPDGQSLMKMLSDGDYIELRHRLATSDRTLARMRPWVALSLLVRTVFDVPSPNMPTALADRAEKRALAMEYLDTWMLQTVFLDMTVDAADLSSALRDKNLACSIRSNVVAYRAGSEAAFATGASAGPGTTNAETAAIATREKVWTDKLVELLSRNKRVFVAIGVSNIVGPTGIAARLEQAGFTVTRVR
jgi:uncharacterized protein YbaP (TraB family)